MWNQTFKAVYDITTGITLGAFLTCILAALVLGGLITLVSSFRSRCSSSFMLTLAMLPAIVAVVIMLVNGNLGAGVAVAGAFSLVRFRSIPGTAKEIGMLFLSMAVGLACGMGYPVFAAVFTVLMCAVVFVYALAGLGQKRDFKLRRILRVTVPEDLDYGDIFDDLFAQFTHKWDLLSVKTTNMGSLNRLTYEIVLKKGGTEKALIDALRCRNGNLEISLSYQSNEMGEL